MTIICVPEVKCFWGAKMIGISLFLLATVANSFHLLNPTPQEELRDMVPERPDQPESPYTVDAGHIQLEVDAVVLRASASDDYELDLFRSMVRVGVSENLGFQVMLPALTLQGVAGPSLSSTADAMTFRMKWNLIGNNGGEFGLALMPWWELPIGDLDTDAGILVPMNLELTERISIGAMLDIAGEDLGKKPDLRLGVSGALGCALWRGLSVYVDGAFNPRPFNWNATEIVVGTGVTLSLSSDVQIDAGLRKDLWTSASTTEAFMGFSIRR